MNQNGKFYIGAALILVSILPLTQGARLAGAQSDYIKNSSVREATVVDYAAKQAPRARGSRTEVFSVVEFVDDDGTRRTAQTNVASYPPSNVIGEQVAVRVHHSRPDDVRLTSFSGLWLESAFYLIPGLLTLIPGLLLVFRKSKSRIS